jgi:hypothetical protein
MIYDDMIFINCDWVSTRWQFSVNLHINIKETTIYVRKNNTKNNEKTHNSTKIESKTYKTRKQM